jgi:hypothetical protein
MKPRRWYSGAEFNPMTEIPSVRPCLSQIHWKYASRLQHDRSVVIKHEVVEFLQARHRHQALAVAALRRCDAA